MHDLEKQVLVEALKTAPDCGDNSCRFRYKDPDAASGMRTNGGCRCHENNPRDVKMFALRLKQVVEVLLDEVQPD